MSTISSSTTSTTAYKVTADTTGALVIQTGATPTTAVTIDTSQNVGIGTTSPSTWGKFAVVGASSGGQVVAAITNTSGTANTQAVLSFDTTNNGFNVRDSQIRATNNGVNQTTLEFYTANAATPAERMRIDASGNVGIGTTAPSSYGLLSVVSSTAGSAKISIQDTSGGASPAPLLQFGVNSSNGFNTSDAARVWTTSPSSSTAALNFAAYNGGAPSTAQMTLTGGNLTTTGTLTTSARGIAKASMPAGTVLQVVNVQTGAYSSTTAVIPLDTTIPQNTEGTELFTVAITPTSSTSKLLIQVNVMFTVTSSQWCTIALFQDSTANALIAVPNYINIATAGITTSLMYYMTSGTTSATTFKLRYGQPTSGATIGINGPTGGAAFFGGVCISGMTVTEIAV